jgi:hypothetical protein
MTLKYKIASGLAAGTMLASMVSTAAFADTTVTVSGNGNGSTNGVTVDQDTTNVNGQLNLLLAENNVDSNANTGGNSASHNNGKGNSSVDTGNATSNVTITNQTGNNTITTDGSCTCGSDTTVKVKGNDKDSENTVDVSSDTDNWNIQANVLAVSNGVTTHAKTGKNKANHNNGKGNKKVTTGNSHSTVTVTNKTGNNTLTVNP